MVEASTLQSADVVRRLTGEGYLETKDLLTVPGTFLPGHKFKVHVVTDNAGAGRVNDPLTVSSMNIQENAGMTDIAMFARNSKNKQDDIE